MSNNKADNSFPMAMNPPDGKMTVITAELIKSAIYMSRKSPRGRIILPFHKSNNDSLHRMLNVLQPLSYIQPHRHTNPPKAETIIVLQGTIAYLTFNEDGKITEALKLSKQCGNIGVDTEPDIYHTFFALEQDTVLFEIKIGPYQKISDKDFAKWAPPEKSATSMEYIKSLYSFVDNS